MKKIILALACCSIFASCVKEEDKKAIDVSKTTFLMKKGAWQLKVSTWLPDIADLSIGPVDMYGPMPGCEKDDFYIFNTSNRTSLYEGNTKCVVTNPDSVVYGYALKNDDKYLEIIKNPDEPDPIYKLAGDITYPGIDTFVVTYLKPNPTDSTKTSRYTEKYVRLR